MTPAIPKEGLFFSQRQMLFEQVSERMAYWHDYKTDVKDTGGSVDGSSAGIAAKYLYRPSKTVEMYVGCGYSQWDRLDAGAVKTDKSVNAYSGVTKYF